MKSKDLVKKIENEILNGDYVLPFANKNLPLQNGACYIPNKPNKAWVTNINNKGKGFYSVSEKDYDIKSAKEKTEDLLRYINSKILDDYELKVEFVKGLNGLLPKYSEKLDSLYFDNRIKIRPVGLRQIYNFSARLKYYELTQKMLGGINATVRNVELNIKDLLYQVPLSEEIRYARRKYIREIGIPLQVQRAPIWINVNSKGIEKEARVPLEVLSNLVEPYTSARIVARIIESNQMHKEDYEKAKLIKQKNKLEKIRQYAKKDVEEIMKIGISEEMAVVSGIVKKWLVKNSSKNKLNLDDIVAWNPYLNTKLYDSDFTLEIQKELARCPPAKMIKFYCSKGWRDWVDEYGSDLDLSKFDFDY